MSHSNPHPAVLTPQPQALGGQGPFSAKHAVSILRVLVQQVGSLHAAGSIHGGIQSDAVLVNHDGSLRLASSTECADGDVSAYDSVPADLEGVSLLTLPKKIDEAAALLKQSGKDVDPRRVDVYQLGVLGCRLLTGRSLSAYLRSPKVKAQVPGPLQSLVDAALGFDPDRRMADCEALADALAQIDLSDDITEANESGAWNASEPTSRVGTHFEQELGHSDDTPLPGRMGVAEPPTPTTGMVADGEHSISPQLLPTSADELSFQTLGPYKIVARLGRGGMGDVYQAYDESLERRVAIKVLPPELARHATFVRRFKVEAAAVAKLSHPNVVQVYCTGEAAGLQFFVMEFVAGESLAQLLSGCNRVEVDQAVSIVTQCLHGLEAAHAAGLVHRDVKPGNILLERSTGRVLLADFGLVKAAWRGNSMSSAEMMVGTADYLSPEQAQNKKVDCRADLYSLGVVLYQMLSGQVPFQAESSTGKLIQHAFETARPLAEIAPHVPRQLASIVARLMAKDRGKRYQTAGEALAALESFQAGTLDAGEFGAFDKTSQAEASGGRLAALGRNRIAPFFRSLRGADARLKPAAGRRPPRRWKALAIALACMLPMVGFGFIIFPDGTRNVRPIPGEEGDLPPVRRNVPALVGTLRTQITNSLGMKLTLIQPGEFMMGTFDTEDGARLEEHPRHRVRLTQHFYMGIHEVTRGQFREFYKATDQATREEIDRKNGYGYDPATRGLMDFGREFTWENIGWDQGPDHPVLGISYHSAVAFCVWLSRKESKTYRLPTEAEWEYCCRANTTTRFYCGDFSEDLVGYENTFDSSAKDLVVPTHFSPWNDGFPFTSPVGRFKSNPFGLYDMLGNVREFCLDNYMSNYGSSVMKVDPVGPGLGIEKVVRGGAWNRPPPDCRSASRGPSLSLDGRIHDTGFRVMQQIGNEPLPAAEPRPMPMPRDPDRRAAERVLSRGGYLQLQTIGADGKPSGNNEQFRELINLPPIPFQLTNIDLGGRRKVTDDDLWALRGLKYLVRLNLSGTSVSTGGVTCLGGLTNLTELNLNQTQATDEMMPQLNSLPKLKTLNLAGTFVTDDGLLKLSMHPALESLDLTGTCIRGHCFGGFQRAKSLKALLLGETKVTNENLCNLRRLSGLTHVTLSKMQISNRGLEELLNTPNLRSLDIRGAKISLADLELLKEFKHLKTLLVSRSTFSDEFAKSLQDALPDCLIKE